MPQAEATLQVHASACPLDEATFSNPETDSETSHAIVLTHPENSCYTESAFSKNHDLLQKIPHHL